MPRLLRLLFVLPLCLLLAAGAAQADPPTRVGRLAEVEGTVMLRAADADDWEAAELNWPLTAGDVLATDSGSRAEIRVGSTVLRLAGATEIEIRALDDERFELWLEHGSMALRVRSDDPEAAVTVATRDAEVVAADPGQYRIDYVGGGTALSAWSGRLQVRTDNSRAVIHAGQRAELWTDAAEPDYRWSVPEHDAFASWVLARDARDEALSVPRYVSTEITGVEELAEHGSWDRYPEYGTVWYPHRISSDWAPYRWGRWVWVKPWGWTWLDDARWGFAPFHYGRWVKIRGRWAWVPGTWVRRPVYAPALVVWLGSPGWSIGFSSGHRPAVGWFPLGPRDVFVPSYRASPDYVRKLNRTHVAEHDRIRRSAEAPHRAPYTHRHDRDALTVVPVEAVSAGRPVRGERLRDAPSRLHEVPLATVAPVRPAVRSAAPEERERIRHFNEQRTRRDADDDRRRGDARERHEARRNDADTERRRSDNARPLREQTPTDIREERGRREAWRSEANGSGAAPAAADEEPRREPREPLLGERLRPAPSRPERVQREREPHAPGVREATREAPTRPDARPERDARTPRQRDRDEDRSEVRQAREERPGEQLRRRAADAVQERRPEAREENRNERMPWTPERPQPRRADPDTVRESPPRRARESMAPLEMRRDPDAAQWRPGR